MAKQYPLKANYYKKIISLLLVVFSYSKKSLKRIKNVLVEYITTKN